MRYLQNENIAGILRLHLFDILQSVKNSGVPQKDPLFTYSHTELLNLIQILQQIGVMFPVAFLFRRKLR